MYQSKKIVAFIGARGGSKGLKNKNLKELAGDPLIVWTIKAALSVKMIDRVLVSTDSPVIAKVAQKAGASVPFLRPKFLATDKASQSDAIKHALEFLRRQGEHYDFILLLQPTSPLRTAKHIEQAIRHYFTKDKRCQGTLVSVYQAPLKMGWLMQESSKGQIKFCFDVSKNFNRQMLNSYFLPNGAIYFAPVDVFMKEGFYSRRTWYYKMDPEVSIDIDTAKDFQEAEGVLAGKQSKT